MKTLLPLIPALILFPLGTVFFNTALSKLVWATVGLLFLVKVGALIRNKQSSMALPTEIGWVFYLFLWPGVRPESFSKKLQQEQPIGNVFVKGFLFFIAGLVIQLFLFFYWDKLPTQARQYAGLLSFLIAIHLGFSYVLFVLFRLLGWPVEPLFRSSLNSSSLRDFWSRRWNLAFVDMDKRLFLPIFTNRWLKKIRFIGIFILSGILHEIGISYPAGAGWGGPLLYFILHGILTWIEPKIPLLKKSPFINKLWLWLCIFIPFPILFHQAFLNAFIEPYFSFGHQLISTLNFREALKWSIIICGIGHLLILLASFQVPKKLNWKTEFLKLSTFSRKIFWTYGGYIVFCIISFAFIDLFNTEGLLKIHPSSLVIALFIALFWTGRVIVDFFYYKHDDWPPGDQFVIGHTCLTTLFCFLAIVHWGLVIWQLN